MSSRKQVVAVSSLIKMTMGFAITAGAVAGAAVTTAYHLRKENKNLKQEIKAYQREFTAQGKVASYDHGAKLVTVREKEEKQKVAK